MNGEEIVHVPGHGQDHDGDGEHTESESERRKGERKFAIMLRRQQVAERLVAHWPYRAIARELGVSLGTIAKDVAKIREEWRDRLAQTYEEHVAEEFGKLDQVEMALLPKVLHGGRDGGASLNAAQVWLAVSDRRARLMGLDKPQRAEITIDVSDLDAQRQRAAELIDLVERRNRQAG